MDLLPQLDLSKIYHRPVFRSHSAEDSHQALSKAITPHQLNWGHGDVSTALYRRELNRISMMILSYGAEVEVRPHAFKDFVLVQMPLRGSAEIESDGVGIHLNTGEVAVVAPRRSIRLHWQADCEQLILKLPADLLRQVACHTCARSHCPSVGTDCQPWIDPVFKLVAGIAPLWHALLQQMLSLLTPAHTSKLHPAWINQFEQTAALFLQSHQPSVLERDNKGDDDNGDFLQVSAAFDTRLTRIEDYMRSRLFAPISLADLARVAGVSPRTLNVLCHRHRGVAPMVLLRNLRLEAARNKLVADPRASVTEVAMEYGFGHLGRFSAYYRERFGELPRQTGLMRH